MNRDDQVDRKVLEALLWDQGLGRHSGWLAREVAEVGLRLGPTRASVDSRLGWPALLPPGESWPHVSRQRALTFLAGINLAELPAHDPLPEGGWLLFFADIEPDSEGLIDFAPNEPGAAARVMYLEAGVDPISATPPDHLGVTLSARSVVALPQLTLADDYEAVNRLALGPAEGRAYEDFVYQLRYGEDGSSLPSADHWLLGAWTGVQTHPTEADTVLLLHFAYDEPLGFEFLDAGAIQFRIHRNALSAGDWSAVVAEADSG